MNGAFKEALGLVERAIDAAGENETYYRQQAENDEPERQRCWECKAMVFFEDGYCPECGF